MANLYYHPPSATAVGLEFTTRPASVDLLFWVENKRPILSASADEAVAGFSVESTSPTPPVNLSGVTEDAVASLVFPAPFLAYLEALAEDAQGVDFTLVYTASVDGRGPGVSLTGHYGLTSAPSRPFADAVSLARRQSTQSRMPWHEIPTLSGYATGLHAKAPAKDIAIHLAWGLLAAFVDAGIGAGYRLPDRKSLSRHARWGWLWWLSAGQSGMWELPARVSDIEYPAWGRLVPQWHGRVSVWHPRAPGKRTEKAIAWGLGLPPTAAVPPVQPPAKRPCYQPPLGNAVYLLFSEALGGSLALVFRCRSLPLPFIPSIPIRRVYYVSSEIQLERVSDHTLIPTSGMQLSLDADKAHWDFSATILGKAALDAVMPDISGEPVLLEATINGYTWRVLVEHWEAESEGRNRQRTIRGRSLSATLASPYELQADRSNSSPATANQLANAALPIGWDLTWNATDWIVPAGAWNAPRTTPIQAIKGIADAIRAVVIPDRNGKTLTVKPRYPVSPWEFELSTPDISVPGSAIAHVSMRQAIPAQANAIIVLGGNVGGVVVDAKREGTAGDRLLPAVQNNLITTVAAGRALATGLLSGQSTQPIIRGFTMPLKAGDFPLVEIGNLIHVVLTRDVANAKGVANSVAISAVMKQSKAGKSVPEVRQQITLGEDTPNLWASWLRNIPASPLMLGEVVSVLDGLSVRVAVTGGTNVTVRGTASVGDKVWFKDGRIDGIAPAGFPIYEIEV